MVIDKFPLTLVTRSHWELVNYRRFLTSLVVNWLSVAFCYRSQKLFSQPSHGKNRYRNLLLLFTFSRRKASSRSFCRVKQNGIKWDEKLSIKSCIFRPRTGNYWDPENHVWFWILNFDMFSRSNHVQVRLLSDLNQPNCLKASSVPLYYTGCTVLTIGYGGNRKEGDATYSPLRGFAGRHFLLSIRSRGRKIC